MTATPTHLGAESFRRLFERSVSAPAPTDIPQPIVDWMSSLMLLEGLPFEYLVPHPAMLPEESIRFFLLDRNWQYRLIEGAASAGVGSSRDGLQLLSSLDELARQAAEHAPALRPAALGIAQPAANDDPWSGLLLRSTAVQGWPGIEVRAHDATGATLPTLRMDRLSPNILLCIFQGVSARVDLMEPPETLHFGVLNKNKASDPDKAYYVVLRGLGVNNLAAGVQLPGATARTASVELRGGGAAGVIDIARTAQSLKQGLSDNHALSPEGTFTSAEFAVQMVRAAGLQSFEQEGP